MQLSPAQFYFTAYEIIFRNIRIYGKKENRQRPVVAEYQDEYSECAAEKNLSSQSDKEQEIRTKRNYFTEGSKNVQFVWLKNIEKNRDAE